MRVVGYAFGQGRDSRLSENRVAAANELAAAPLDYA